ncbi:MAG: hypothetical protein R3C68_14005 [Myxococcota bacterium]
MSYVGLAISLGWGLEAILMLLGAPGFLCGTLLWAACSIGLLLYVLRGLQYSGFGLYGLVILAYAPIYIVWKL